MFIVTITAGFKLRRSGMRMSAWSRRGNAVIMPLLPELGRISPGFYKHGTPTEFGFVQSNGFKT